MAACQELAFFIALVFTCGEEVAPMPSVVAVTEFQIDGDAVLSMAESRSCIVEDHCDTRFLARGESVVLIHGDKRINGIVDVRQRVAPGRALYAVRMVSN